MLGGMERELAAVADELRRRAQVGESAVYLSDEALGWMREVVAAARQRGAGQAQRSEAEVVTGLDAEDLALLRKAPEKPPVRKAAGQAAAGRGEAGQAGAAEAPPGPVLTLPTGVEGEAALAWLRGQLEADVWCKRQLKRGGKLVLSEGPVTAELAFVGEAPGEVEARQGRPFVGPAGELLDGILRAMGVERAGVYISNIVKFRPPMATPVGNRAPRADEMAYCLPYLRMEMAIVRPRVIVALGKTAVEGLLGVGPEERMGALRGHWQAYEGVAVMPTYHPSYLLHNNALATKRLVWEDMLKVMERLGMPISERQRGFFL